MPSTLFHRLAKLEERLSERQHGQGRIFRVIAAKEERDEAYNLALAEGFDPGDDSDDILIMRLIAVPPGRPAYSQPPRVL
jgi:hypothetical protein